MFQLLLSHFMVSKHIHVSHASVIPLFRQQVSQPITIVFSVQYKLLRNQVIHITLLCQPALWQLIERSTILLLFSFLYLCIHISHVRIHCSDTVTLLLAVISRSNDISKALYICEKSEFLICRHQQDVLYSCVYVTQRAQVGDFVPLLRKKEKMRPPCSLLEKIRPN